MNLHQLIMLRIHPDMIIKYFKLILLQECIPWIERPALQLYGALGCTKSRLVSVVCGINMSEKQVKCILLTPELEPLNESGRFRRTLTQLEWLEKFTREDKTVGDKTPVFGAKGHTGQAYNMGFYSAIKLAYNYHFVLNTCPEDWWYCISQQSWTCYW